VINLGAVPILVDVDPHELCITADTIEATISPQTRAVLGIHMYSSRADLSAINAVCAARGVALIEDASQAHGAWIGAQRTGSFGAISIFSFQQSKLLTGGEGGIAVTDDDVLYQRMQQYRADGRLYADPAKDRTPFAELVVKGDVLGRNLCMTEFQAVLLQEGLGRLDIENEHRRGMAAHLARRLADVQWVSLIRDQLDPAAGATFYKIPLRVADARLVKLGPTLLARALTAELNLPVEPLDRPLNQAPLYCPERTPLVLRLPEFANRCAPGRFSLPNAEEAWRTSVCLPHQCLMGSEFDIDSIVVALQKVQLNATALELVAQTDAELRGRPS
jgi:dTDP-4-amino-4,6-dideoxygalactose transaminase